MLMDLHSVMISIIVTYFKMFIDIFTCTLTTLTLTINNSFIDINMSTNNLLIKHSIIIRVDTVYGGFECSLQMNSNIDLSLSGKTKCQLVECIDIESIGMCQGSSSVHLLLNY